MHKYFLSPLDFIANIFLIMLRGPNLNPNAKSLSCLFLVLRFKIGD